MLPILGSQIGNVGRCRFGPLLWNPARYLAAAIRMMKHIVPIAIALGVAAADLAAAQTTHLPPVSIEDTLAFRQIEQAFPGEGVGFVGHRPDAVSLLLEIIVVHDIPTAIDRIRLHNDFSDRHHEIELSLISG